MIPVVPSHPTPPPPPLALQEQDEHVSYTGTSPERLNKHVIAIS